MAGRRKRVQGLKRALEAALRNKLARSPGLDARNPSDAAALAALAAIDSQVEYGGVGVYKGSGALGLDIPSRPLLDQWRALQG